MFLTFPAAIAVIGMILYGPIAIAHEPASQSYQAQSTVIAQYRDSALYEIQQRIDKAFIQGMAASDPSAMEALATELQAFYTDQPLQLVRYWQGYLAYKQAIYWLVQEDEKLAEKATERSIDWIEDIDEKNSEDYALLALVESFGIQFQPGFKAPIISARVKKYAEKAASLDSTNLRAFYVLASNDYYTPEQFGGMQQVEDYLKTAISLPAQSAPNPYLPAWGREEAYEMLVKFYLRKDQLAEAKSTYQQAIAEYPGSYQIIQLASKLISE